MKQDIPNANVKARRVYLFEDGDVYEAEVNESFYNNAAFKYKVTRINRELACIVYDKSKEVKFSDKYNAMEFNNPEHFNKYLQQESYEKVARLASEIGMKLVRI